MPVEPVRVWNPPNPYLTDHRELLGEPPAAELEIYEDTSQSILSTNDSPDIGFRWSVNPYRGCRHACLYCMSGDTKILLPTGRIKPLADLRIGEEVIGTGIRGISRDLVKTRVLAHWTVTKKAYRITLTDRTRLVAAGDHRFLTDRGWQDVTGLTRASELIGPDGNRPVRSIELFDRPMLLFDITTGTGDFIANGVISHNCYARPTHEYFGLGAGTDFERKIFVKRDAPALLEEAFQRRSWKGEQVVFSGVTDCYQPLEAAWELTRGCLAVCLKYRNPVGIITKSALIRRDVELLKGLAREASVGVSISIPFLDEETARLIEPGAPTIAKRFETLEILAGAGIPTGIGVAPIIPGLNDRDIPGLLKEAKRRGARFAFRTLLRLPGSVREVFLHGLAERMPLRAEHIRKRILDTRGGRMYDSRFGHRHSGTGEYWEMIDQAWDVWTERFGFNREEEDKEGPERPSTFRRPVDSKGQALFLY